ncbi:MAG: fibrobacter succinogenes major paralogous domain-containing protein, partial [Bacteroidales bacterium]|nr:fibrobacter succinogenes major paralogous domain-containing protein [Bacteroidales bacterium]
MPVQQVVPTGGVVAGASGGKTNKSSALTGTLAGHEYVDLGLPSGTLWATCNVGANRPEDYGDYYAWGETTIKTKYKWNTYKWCRGSWRTQTKYNTNSKYGTVDNKTVLEMSDDAVSVNWGGDWRMPTTEEWEELCGSCTWTWTGQGGKIGYRVTGPNGKSIFLPAAGYRSGTSLNGAGSYGYYWSSSLSTSDPNCGRYLYFVSSFFYLSSRGSRYCGCAVRPVCPPQD